MLDYGKADLYFRRVVMSAADFLYYCIQYD